MCRASSDYRLPDRPGVPFADDRIPSCSADSPNFPTFWIDLSSCPRVKRNSKCNSALVNLIRPLICSRSKQVFKTWVQSLTSLLTSFLLESSDQMMNDVPFAFRAALLRTINLAHFSAVFASWTRRSPDCLHRSDPVARSRPCPAPLCLAVFWWSTCSGRGCALSSSVFWRREVV